MIFKLWYIHIYCIHLYNYIIIWICILIIYIYCIDIYMYHLSILNPEFFLSSQTRQPPRAAQNWKNFAKLRSEDPTEYLRPLTAALEDSWCFVSRNVSLPWRSKSARAWSEILLKSGRFWPPDLRSFQPSLRRRCVVLGCQLPECWFANTKNCPNSRSDGDITAFGGI